MSQVDQHVRLDDGPGYGSDRSNTRISGPDIDRAVFPVSALTIIVFVLGTLLFPEKATLVFGGIRTWLTTQFDWLFLLTANFVLLFCLCLAVSPLGKVRLGGRAGRPRVLLCQLVGDALCRRHRHWADVLRGAGAGPTLSASPARY